MDEIIENKLVEEAKNGSVQAFEQLILQYEKIIYAICLRLLCNEQEAYDAAQEVCIKIWRQIHTFEGNAKLTTWVYRIATNQCLDIIRKNKRKEEVSLFQENKETGELQLIDKVDSGDTPDMHIEHLVLQDAITMALTEIKDEYREILVLRDMEGYSYEEIGHMLNLGSGTVKSRLSRARSALKKILLQNKEPYISFFRQNTKRRSDL